MPRYSQQLLDHFQNPRNAGVMEQPDGEALVSNPQCGDTMKLFIKVERGVIVDARWQTRGCSAAIAASSVASELIKGRPVAEGRRLTRAAIARALGGLPPSKVHCSVLAVDALREALADYEARQGRMNTSRVELRIPDAVAVEVTDDALTIELSDGRAISVPLAWYPRLFHATPQERGNWRLIGKGQGIHWEDLDEDISVEGLLTGRRSGESQTSLKHWLETRAKR